MCVQYDLTLWLIIYQSYDDGGTLRVYLYAMCVLAAGLISTALSSSAASLKRPVDGKEVGVNQSESQVREEQIPLSKP